MKIRSLAIRRMPGFENAGFDLTGLSEGLNLIIGPNASGKTTTCHAIRGLLWPEELAGLSPVSLASEWVDGPTAWRLEVEGDKTACQRDGVPADRPPLPPPNLARCFTITVDNLFEDTQTDEALAGNVAREMAGGYDLGALRSAAWMKLSAKHGRKERDELRDRTRAAEGIRARQQELLRQEQELAGLEEQARQSREAQWQLSLVRTAIELLELRAPLDAARAALAALPQGMEKLQGNEAQALAQIQDDLDEQARAATQARAAMEDAARLRREAALPEEGVAQPRIDQQQGDLEALRDIQKDIRGVHAKLADADAQVKTALKALGPAADEKALDALDAHALDAIETFHAEAQAHKARLAAVEGQLHVLGTDEPAPTSLESLIGGINILQEWLDAAPGEAAQPARRVPSAAIVAALALAAVGVVLAIVVHPWWLLCLAPAALLAGAALGPATAPADTTRRSLCQEQYARTDLPPLPAWDRQAVLDRLHELRRQQADECLRDQRAQQRQARRQDLARLEQDGRAMEARRRTLVDAMGVPVEGGDMALVALAANLRAYSQSHAAQQAARGELAVLEKERTDRLGTLNAFLGEFGCLACDSYESARAQSESVFARAQSHRQAGEQADRAAQAAASAREKADALRQRLEKLFQQAGLADGDVAALAAKLKSLGDYRATVKRLGELEAQAAPLAAKVQAAEGLAALTLEEAHARAGQLADQADQLAGLSERIGGIRSQLQAARTDRSLEEALARVDQASDALRRRREEAQLAAAGHFLLDRVEAEHKVESRPAVFRRAAEWFGRFTRGRYELRIEESAAAFRAVDTAGGAGLALKELSRGTRMQLLLAVRLAFAAQAERGTPLPFILDEVLSSTDPTRYRAVTECLLALVKEGRQVFYMTCQPGDAAAWREIALEMGIPEKDARVVDLAALRRLAGGTSALLDESAAHVAPVPEPGAMSLGEYARAVGAPPLAPAAGADANHLAHFVETPAQLYTLLRAGIETYGQVRAMAACGRVDAYVGDDLLSRMAAHAAAMNAFAEGWRIGRGKGLTREALADAGISDTFIDPLSEMAQSLDWDAKRFMHALETRQDKRTKGFRSDRIEPAREFFAENGYLDPATPLDKGQLHARVLAAANDALRAGLLEAGQVNDLFEGLWALASA